MRALRLDFWTVGLIVGWAIVFILLIYPLQSIVLASFIDNISGDLTFHNYWTIFSEYQYRSSIINTFIGGFGGMVGALILGVTLAAITSRFHIKGRAVISALAVMALVSPPFIGAYAWIILFGANGVVRRALIDIGIPFPAIYGAWGVILVFSLKLFPYVFLITSTSLRNVNASLEEAAESLGMSPRKRFFKVTLRLIGPAITASALLTFILSIADFGTPRIIGRKFQMLSTEAYTLFASETGGNPGMASAISMVLLLISLVFVVLQRRFSRHDLSQGSRSRPRDYAHLTVMKSIAAHLTCYCITLIGILPTIMVVIFSFRNTRGPVFQPGFGLDSYRQIISDVPVAISNSFVYAATATLAILVAGTILGYIIVRRRGLFASSFDGVLMVPYIVPGIVIGIAYAASFNTGPLTMTGTGLIIIAVIFMRRLPYAMRAIISSLQQVSPSIENAAISLGYHPFKVLLKVTIPLIAPGILAGAVMCFVTGINELSAVLVLHVGSTITMPVKIYTMIGNGEYGTAAALSTILQLTTGTLVYLAFRLSGGRQLM